MNGIFETISLIAVILIQPKLMFKKIWKTKESLDDEVSNYKKMRLLKQAIDFPLLWNIKFPRFVRYCTKYRFSYSVDASQVVYAACIFIRC